MNSERLHQQENKGEKTKTVYLNRWIIRKYLQHLTPRKVMLCHAGAGMASNAVYGHLWWFVMFCVKSLKDGRFRHTRGQIVNDGHWEKCGNESHMNTVAPELSEANLMTVVQWNKDLGQLFFCSFSKLWQVGTELTIIRHPKQSYVTTMELVFWD